MARASDLENDISVTSVDQEAQQGAEAPERQQQKEAH
jgi:hypothetical protein